MIIEIKTYCIIAALLTYFAH